jgi:hemoglobin-like flavoprotein
MDRPGIARQVRDQQLLAESLALVAPVANELVTSFYTRLFADNPHLRPMFPAGLDAQKDKLLKAIMALVTHYHRPEQLIPALTVMGRQHDSYGVRIEHYCAVGLALVATLRRFAGDAWNAEYEGAWQRAYTFAAGVMMQASAVTTGAEPVPGRLAAA